MTRIETERLVVRNFEDRDIDDLHEYLSLEETYRFEPGSPIDLAEAGKLVDERKRADVFLAVELKETARMIGHLYFALMEPEEFRTWELGYIFNPRFHNRGFGTEAARALLGHAFAAMDIHRVIAKCDPVNVASWRLLEKAGMRREGHFLKSAFFRRDGNGAPLWHDCYQYAVLKEEMPAS
jgi:[ribosomal protein S5]-alanine N-acetyltransferase